MNAGTNCKSSCRGEEQAKRVSKDRQTQPKACSGSAQMTSQAITKSCQEATVSPTVKRKHKEVAVVIGMSQFVDWRLKNSCMGETRDKAERNNKEERILLFYCLCERLRERQGEEREGTSEQE